MKFVKLEGCGNDYVVVNCFEETVSEPEKLAARISDRHFGIGSDGLILLERSSLADVGMRIFNPDGSEAEMCGNGIRCLAKLAHDSGVLRKSDLKVHTKAGIMNVELLTRDGRVTGARVNMGKPRLHRSEIPMLGDVSPVVDEPIEIGGEGFSVTCVSMGNPHCVIFEDNLDDVPLSEWGPMIEHCSLFPKRTNVEFVKVESRGEIRVRVWERGAGATLACGTGACACVVAGVLNKKTDRKVLCHLPGGDLEVEWAEHGSVYMAGPVREVYRGELSEEF